MASHPDQVEVPCTMTIDEGFTAYILKCRTPNGRVWATARRFSEFDELRVVLVRMRACARLALVSSRVVSRVVSCALVAKPPRPDANVRSRDSVRAAPHHR